MRQVVGVVEVGRRLAPGATTVRQVFVWCKRVSSDSKIEGRRGGKRRPIFAPVAEVRQRESIVV